MLSNSLRSSSSSVAAATAASTKRAFSKTISPSAIINNNTKYNNNSLQQQKSLPLFDFFAQTKPRKSFTLGHGAAGFAKKRSNNTPVYTSSSHSSISAQVGEDAYFRRADAIGVADGIGGWSDTAGKLKQVPKKGTKNFFFSELCVTNNFFSRINFYIQVQARLYIQVN
jgi:hypothetical protein